MLKLLEECFAVVMLAYLSGGITGFWAGDSPFNLWRLQDNPLLLGIQMVMYGVTLSFIVLHWRKFTSGGRAGGWVLALALLALASTLWSSDPAFTLRRSLVLIATTGFGIYFGSRYEPRRQVRLLAWTFILLAIVSAGCALLLPQYGVDSQLHPGDWHGILGQKNLLGKAMAVALILLWSAKGAMPGLLRMAGLSLCAALMMMSGSRVAPVVCAALLLLVPTHRILRARITAMVPLAIVSLAMVAGAVFFIARNSSLLLAFLTRDATLTRRTEIWRAVWAAISNHVALGYGFSGFWAGVHGESATVAGVLRFSARHAHNGFLDLWLELGIVGLVLFSMGYLRALGDGVALLRMSPDRLATWPLQYLGFMLLYHLAEGPILRQNSIYWALYVGVVVAAALARIGSNRICGPRRRSA